MSVVNESVIKKIRLTEEKSDHLYWSNQPVEVRLDALESMRQEYNSWKFHDQQRFQRISSVTGLEFAEFYATRVHVDIQGVGIDFVDLESFKKNKKAVGRHQDLADLENLE